MSHNINSIESYRLYNCESCGNEISGITKLQQSNPSSKIWARYGLCSAGCMAPISTLRKEESITGRKVESIGSSEMDLSQGKTFEYLYNEEGYVSGPVSNLADKKILSWRRLIFSGKLIGGSGLVAGLVLFYSELVYAALICLILVVTGIVLCRIGVWKKCRIR